MMLKFSAYNYSDEIQSQLKSKLLDILTKHACADLLIPVFTCVNELLMNAIKANYKNIYFENYHDETLPYDQGLKLFRFEISSERIDHLTDIAKKNHKTAVVSARVEKSVLYIDVENPYPMTKLEKENVESKLEFSEHIHSVSDIFDVSERDPYKEGAGLGIIFVAIMLKSMGVPHEKFIIRNVGSKTVSSFSVPLTEETVKFYNNYKER